jgi:hypothetical protein
LDSLTARYYRYSAAVAAVITTDSERTYHFRYSFDKASETLSAFVDEPHGKVIQVRIRNQKGKLAYSIQK